MLGSSLDAQITLQVHHAKVLTIVFCCNNLVKLAELKASENFQPDWRIDLEPCETGR